MKRLLSLAALAAFTLFAGTGARAQAPTEAPRGKSAAQAPEVAKTAKAKQPAKKAKKAPKKSRKAAPAKK